jgi:GGDEF domain-containing protein
LFLLPNTDKSAGELILQRVMDNIDQYNKNNKDLPIALSIGIATGIKEQSLNKVFIEADYSMYQVKEEKKARLSLTN